MWDSLTFLFCFVLGKISQDDICYVVAKYDYTAQGTQELDLRKNERCILLDDSKHWWRVQNSKNQSGYVPSNYVKREKPSLFDSIKKKVSVCVFFSFYFYIFYVKFEGLLLRILFILVYRFISLLSTRKGLGESRGKCSLPKTLLDSLILKICSEGRPAGLPSCPRSIFNFQP